MISSTNRELLGESMWEVWAFEPETRERIRIEIEEGSLDKQTKVAYLNGQCYALALAIHQLFHEQQEDWSLVCWIRGKFLGANPQQWEGQCIGSLTHFSRSWVMHTMVKSPHSQELLDIEGYHRRDEYSHTNPFSENLVCMYITPEKILKLMQSHTFLQNMDAAGGMARTVLSVYGIK
jgi:hypothetical protein